MSTLNVDKLRAEMQKTLVAVGFTVQQTNQVIEGLDAIEELSQELGELSDKTIDDLNQLGSPLSAMMVFSLGPNVPDTKEQFSLLRQLTGEIVRAAYYLGGKDALEWQSQDDRKDFPN